MAENWGTLPSFSGGGAGSPSNTMSRVEAYLPTKWHLDLSSHLATTGIDRILGGCSPLGEEDLCSHQTECGQGRGLPACQVSSWSVQPFGHNTPTLQTCQTDRTGLQPDRQRSDSIGRTVLQTVAQKRMQALGWRVTFCANMDSIDGGMVILHVLQLCRWKFSHT